MERIEPINLSHIIYTPLLGYKQRTLTTEKYYEKINEFEIECENELKTILDKLNIYSIVKTDRYSLPYKKQFTYTLLGESYLNGPYEFFRVLKHFVRTILNEDVSKIRFYILVDVSTVNNYPLINNNGCVKYTLRYYPHKT